MIVNLFIVALVLTFVAVEMIVSESYTDAQIVEIKIKEEQVW
jgi:hypothetical protein